MILNKQKKIRVATRPLSQFLRQAQSELRIANSEVTVALVSDEEIARWNEMYRKKKGPTDVLSFPAVSGARFRFEEKNKSLRAVKSRRAAESVRAAKSRSAAAISPGIVSTARGSPNPRTGNSKSRSSIVPESLGDIAIAPETAQRYAKKNSRSLPTELRVLILHGLLHLIGFDHERDAGQMNRIENKVRRRLGIA